MQYQFEILGLVLFIQQSKHPSKSSWYSSISFLLQIWHWFSILL